MKSSCVGELSLKSSKFELFSVFDKIAPEKFCIKPSKKESKAKFKQFST